MGRKKFEEDEKSKKRPGPDLYSEIFADSTESEEDDVPIKSLQKPEPSKSTKATSELKKSSEVKTPKEQQKSKKLIVPLPTEDSDDSNEEEYEFDDGDESEDEQEMEEPSEEEDEQADEDADEQEESDDEDVPKTVLRKQLKDLSFEELEALKQKMGLKEYNEAMFASKSTTGGRKNPRRKFDKINKHRPKEISSKARVPKLRKVVEIPKRAVRKDPRFDQACGEYNEQIWNNEYSFIRDIQKTEADKMKKQIRSVDDSSKKKEMRRFIQKVTDKEKSIQSKKIAEERRKQEREENKKRVAEGKRPFFVKKSTKKLTELVDKYEELKASGKLEKYLKKKRKKNAVRDRKTLVSK